MAASRAFLGICIIGLFSLAEPVRGETYSVVLHGKVTMPDGSPPPVRGAVERVCSDGTGSAPGPLVDKKGEFIWRMDVDPMRTRACLIQATHAGYMSTSVDISAMNGYLSRDIFLQPIVISSKTADPYAIIINDSAVPFYAISASQKALKALNAKNELEAIQQFQIAVHAAPKFVQGWHALGVLMEFQNNFKEAQKDYERAIEADPKFLPPYMTLARLHIKDKDWENAAKAAESLIKLDKKHLYPEIYLHQAVAQYGLKNFDEAAASALESIRLDPYHKTPRTEYVLGRILEAKGDLEGARQHISKYLELDKQAPDMEMIRIQLQNLGKKEAGGIVPDLENL
jgi:Flp pilus assembly protein TadD